MSDHDTSHAAGKGHGGSEKNHMEKQSQKATFFTVFAILTFLTVVEVFIPQVYSAEWNSHTKMLLLCGLAISKAVLVGLYFMHLKWEKPWLKYIALMPVYMGVFAIILMLETVYRQVGA